MSGRPTITDRIVGLRALKRKGVCPACRQSIPTGVRVLFVETLAPVTVRRGFCADAVIPVKERALCEGCSATRLRIKLYNLRTKRMCLKNVIWLVQQRLQMVGTKE